jgi:hypothetical protein
MLEYGAMKISSKTERQQTSKLKNKSDLKETKYNKGKKEKK